MPATPAAHLRRGIPWLVVSGLLAAAVSLRGPIMAPTPVLSEIEADLGISATAAGLLTTVPVLMFAALTPVAALVIRRAGAEFALLASLCGVLVGTFVRALPGFGWMLVGVLVMGAAITVGNVVIPVVIRRDVPPERAALVTAMYAATLNVGSLVTSLGTAPLASLIGWRAALLAWSLLTVGAIVLWGVVMRRLRSARAPIPEAPPPVVRPGVALDPATITGPVPVVAPRGHGRGLARNPIAWLLLGAFGLQCLIYYALSTWLPTFAADVLDLDPSAAGALASIFQGIGIPAAFLVPLLTRFAPRITAPLTICVSWIVLTVGILLAPELLWLWLGIGAVGHAGGFVVIFATLVRISRNDSEAAGMSAMVQGGGYAIGAIGAPLLGWLHESTGDWTAGLAVMVVLALAYAASLLGAYFATLRRES